MKYNDKEVIEKLKGLKFSPDKEWENNALSIIINMESKKNLFFKFFSMLTKKKIALLAGSSIISGFLLLVVGVLLVNQLRVTNTSLTAEQKQRIYEQIIANNSPDVFSAGERDNQATGEAGALAMDIATTAPLIAPREERNYTYSYIRTTYEPGSGVGKCGSFYSNTLLYSTEAYEYFQGQGDSYYKYIEFDNQGSVNNYNLSKYTSGGSESVEFRGGSYAVRSKYSFAATDLMVSEDRSTEVTIPEEEVVSGPQEETPVTPEPPVDYIALIKQYFGEDVDIVNIVNENGKDYYVLQHTFKTDCSTDGNRLLIELYDPSSLPDTIVVQNYVDSETFEVTKSLNYLGSVDSVNLINTITTIVQTDNVDFGQVSDKFNFEFNVEVRDIEYPEYDPEVEAGKISDFIAEKGIALPFPQNAELQSVYSNELSIRDFALYNYYGDRNFYPAGAKGDEIYSQNTKSYGIDQNQSVLTLGFNLGTDYLSIEVFAESVELPDFGNQPVSTSDTTVSIEGEVVPTKLNMYETESMPLALPDESVSSDLSLIRSFSYKEIIFTYRGYQYRMSLPQSESFEVETLRFEVVNASNAEDMSTLRNQILDIFTKPREVEGKGSSGSIDPVLPVDMPTPVQ